MHIPAVSSGPDVKLMGGGGGYCMLVWVWLLTVEFLQVEGFFARLEAKLSDTNFGTTLASWG